MKTAVLLVSFLVCSLPSLVNAQTEEDRSAILKVFDSWNQGWKDKDVDRAVADYSEDADWTNAFGDRFQGKPALKEGLDFIFSLNFVMAGDSAKNEYTDITFLTPEIALVRSKLVRIGQKTSTGKLMPDRHIHHLRVLEKRNNRWLIVSHLISQAQPKR